jgi:hypothetical protein
VKTELLRAIGYNGGSVYCRPPSEKEGHVTVGPYHCNLNPIELVRSQYVARYNKTYQLWDICQPVQRSLLRGCEVLLIKSTDVGVKRAAP